MRALIIGAAGFVGRYLAEYLHDRCGWVVYATKMPHEACGIQDAEIYDLDILDEDSVRALFEKTKPECVFHLAAQSSVALSWEHPGLTADVNIRGCIHVLEAARHLDKRPRILLVGSSEEYGAVGEEENPIQETALPHPENIYAVTKACQNMVGKVYADAYRMDVIMVRAFNHIGPEQSSAFAVSGFCKQVAEIEKGLREPVIYAGNLSARRDFTDVRDIVRAYALLMQKGAAGEVYNVGSGRAVAIRDVLDEILGLSKGEIRIETDQRKLRPVDVPIVEADIGKLVRETGWEREYPLKDTLKDILDYWRANV